ncbi:MAG TPA: tripartite tricarboxylate transporter substrate binding protein [Symbiobacteriaceae bacterium]|nr:tripartite tricarboxylate transporter substrate binding protein [Symbiobacteriaceae bacterium]
MKRFRTVMGLVLTAALLVATGCAGAKKEAPAPAAGGTAPKTEEKKTWAPDKPVTMIVPYSAGGSTDVLARQVEKVWSKYVSQPLTVVNKPGASGMEGRETVVRSKPDGYTIMMGYGSGEDLIAPQLRKTTFDPIADFQPLGLLSAHSVLITVPANSPYKTMQEMLAGAKAKPLTAALSGVGNLMDIVTRALASTTKAEITGVPFAGGGPATTAMVGGQVDFGPGHPSELMPHVKGGRLRILAVATPDRDPSLPEVPTLKESGVNFTNPGSLKGVAGPKGMPAEIVAYYDDVLKKIAEDPDFKKGMADVFQPVIYKNSADFTKHAKETFDSYGKLIKDLNVKLD